MILGGEIEMLSDKRNKVTWGDWEESGRHQVVMTMGDGNDVKELAYLPYLWFSCRLRCPFLQEVRARGAALGWHNMVTSLPACTCTSLFIGVSEKLGAEAEEE